VNIREIFDRGFLDVHYHSLIKSTKRVQYQE
jgi:hypothetical protein